MTSKISNARDMIVYWPIYDCDGIIYDIISMTRCGSMGHSGRFGPLGGDALEIAREMFKTIQRRPSVRFINKPEGIDIVDPDRNLH